MTCGGTGSTGTGKNFETGTGIGFEIQEPGPVLFIVGTGSVLDRNGKVPFRVFSSGFVFV